MMVRAVQAGTGTAAQISGLRIGGKTGTAETGIDGSNTTWFIAFAGEEGQKPRLAVAVVLQNQSLTGGATAAPIARAGHAGTPDPDGESLTYGHSWHETTSPAHSSQNAIASSASSARAAWRTSGSPRTRSSDGASR